jgi:hypothetical protein
VNSGEGLIGSCGTSGCWNTLGESRCCEFQQGNYIVLYPGELEDAHAAGQSTAHLKMIDDDYHGGKKAVCQAKCTATCDGGFKPLDCVSYPFFPAPPGADEVDLLIKGKKCPLQAEHLRAHAELVREIWNEAGARNPAITAWLNKVELVGYSEPVHWLAPLQPPLLRDAA